MRAFRFRLETSLKLCVAERERRQLELAQAHQAEQLLQRQAEGLAQEIAQAKEQARECSRPGNVDVDRLLELQRYSLQLRGQAMLLAQKIKEVKAEVERRRAVLVEADQKVRMLEKLREKQRLTHRAAEERIEQKVFDEIGQRSSESSGSASGR